MLRKWRLGAGLIFTFGLILAWVGGGIPIASASLAQGNDTKTTICHRTASHTNPYVKITVDNSSVDGNTGNDHGQGDHYAEHKGPIGPVAEGEWGDIIPPVAGHDGLNWTTAGQTIYDNGCKLPGEQPTTPALNTVVFDASAKQALDGTPEAGVSVYDTSSLSGLLAGTVPTGTVTYIFYTTGNCVSPNALGQDHIVVTLVDGAVPNSMTKSNLGAGAYSFKAIYSGDTNYNAAASACEPFTVSKADPSITTTQDPASAAVGAALKDKATLAAGFNPTGTIKFSLVFDSTNTEVYTSTVTVTGNGDFLTSAGTTTGDNVAHNAGSYHWVATYSGDGNNNTKTSTNEPVTITEGGAPTVPAITTTTIPRSTTVGKTLKDSATLSGVEAPNGKITFTLYYPNGTVAYTEDVTGVNANATYTTANGFVATVAGTWHWKAAFIQNGSVLVQSDPASEPVDVSDAGAVLAATGATPPSEMLALLLIAFGFSAIAGGALAMRRREA